ncbi:MAG: hypothetical protein IK064_00430 [Clostridia bacterium]|nr:hypothetical protein [Clostridia bacterium]MBR6006074.1 hypothetical protein [Clostridia bacterium]
MARDTRTNVSSAEPVRVYAPSDGALAYRTDYAYRTAQLAVQPKRKAEPAIAEPEHRRRQQQKRRHVSLIAIARQNKFLPKLLAVCCIAAVAGVAVFAVVRFVNNAKIQANINELNSRIESVERSIDSLNFANQPTVNATEFARTVGLVPAQP